MHFNWLHLTDFHQGMRDQDWLWPNMQEEFFRDLERVHARTGPWDLILFTGDLSDRGDPLEFVRFEQEMAKLRGRLNEIAPGTRPFFLAVPGNHDLIRPAAKDPLVKLLNRWGEDPDVAEAFWTDGTCGYRQVIDTAFAGYSGWWEAQTARLPGYRRGLLPGDFSATIEKDGARLGVLGLNTAFLQLGDGDYQGRLALHPRQFHGACGGSGPEWAREHHACLLLTHHGPTWLDQASQSRLSGDIASYGRFALHLFGHAHESAMQELSEGGAETRRQFQGRSLFGLEHYQEIRDGKTVEMLDRSHGYAVGRLELPSGDDSGYLTFWPRRAWRQGGQRHLIAEPDIRLPADEHTRPLAFPLLQSYRDPRAILPDPGAPPDPPSAAGPTWSMQRLRREGILDELADVFCHESSAHRVLELAGFPLKHLPVFGTGSPAQFWEGVCRELLRGRISGGIDALLAQAAVEYPGNAVFRPWRQGPGQDSSRVSP